MDWKMNGSRGLCGSVYQQYFALNITVSSTCLPKTGDYDACLFCFPPLPPVKQISLVIIYILSNAVS